MFEGFVTLNVAGDTSTLYICINVSVSVTCIWNACQDTGYLKLTSADSLKLMLNCKHN